MQALCFDEQSVLGPKLAAIFETINEENGKPTCAQVELKQLGKKGHFW